MLRPADEDLAHASQPQYSEYCENGFDLGTTGVPSSSQLRLGGILPYEMFQPACIEHISVLVNAFRCGVTNTASMMFGSSGEEYENPEVAGITDHAASHYGSTGNIPDFVAFRKFHMQNVHRLASSLDSLPDRLGVLCLIGH